MKNIITIFMLFVIVLPMFGQRFQDKRPPEERRGQMREKFEQLERIKLLEILDLDEETSIKFFHRQSEHRDNMQNIMDKRMNLISELYKNLGSEDLNKKDYKKRIDEILDIEQELGAERKRFINSLWDLLTPEQIAKVVTFEPRFRDEIRDMIKERGRGQREF